MKKLKVFNWIMIGTMSALFGCQGQTKQDAPQEKTVPVQDDDECEEASYEAAVPGQEKASEEMKEKQASHELEKEVPAETASSAEETTEPVTSKENLLEKASAETSEEISTKTSIEAPSIEEAPTTQVFEDLPASPTSENTVVYSS
jgi:hypothetical protein